MKQNKSTYRVRIIPLDSGGYEGQVYGLWTNLLLGTSYEGWGDVTGYCITRAGAKLALIMWKNKQEKEKRRSKIKEFTL